MVLTLGKVAYRQASVLNKMKYEKDCVFSTQFFLGTQVYFHFDEGLDMNPDERSKSFDWTSYTIAMN